MKEDKSEKIYHEIHERSCVGHNRENNWSQSFLLITVTESSAIKGRIEQEMKEGIIGNREASAISSILLSLLLVYHLSLRNRSSTCLMHQSLCRRHDKDRQNKRSSLKRRMKLGAKKYTDGRERKT
jgi:hypothetical protein